MAITEAQARANKKSQERLDAITLRPMKEEGAAIRAAAAAAGMKLSPYIMQAIRAQMKADASGMYLVCISKEDAQSLVDGKGQTLADWLEDHQ